MEKKNIIKAFAVMLTVLLVSLLITNNGYADIICVDPFDVNCYSTIQDGINAADS